MVMSSINCFACEKYLAIIVRHSLSSLYPFPFSPSQATLKFLFEYLPGNCKALPITGITTPEHLFANFFLYYTAITM